MKFSILLVAIVCISGYWIFSGAPEHEGAPPYDVEESDVPEIGRYEWMNTWKRPDGPVSVTLQAGHWKNDELPDELKKLRGSTGATGGGMIEWEANYAIAEETARLLEEEGVHVTIVPATVPENHWSDVFIAIHADGSTDEETSGYKVASPWRDMTGSSDDLARAIASAYHEATKLPEDPNITRNMRGYYAFSWWRYAHAVHPMTTSVIVETGFLTNPSDRSLIAGQPHIPAKGIAQGVLSYLRQRKLLT